MQKLLSFIILIHFVFMSVTPGAGLAQSLSAAGMMPEPGEPVALSAPFNPASLRGMVISPTDPFGFDFIVFRGDEVLTTGRKREEYARLIKYFLAALAVPDQEQWVNLSPYEKDRIIPDAFGLTEMGRDLLAQDYWLKQITASLSDPGTSLGKTFWDAVYARAYQKLGTTDIPTDVFNKVWITPDSAEVLEKGNTMMVLGCHLKVTLESDLKAAEKNSPAGESDPVVTTISKEMMRELIVPVLEKEVNEGRSFAPLRQVYSAMLLATWYKMALKESLMGQLYVDKRNVLGINQDPRNNQVIFNRYIEAFRKGVVNLIREDADSYSQEVLPRKYFSGGVKNDFAMVMTRRRASEGARIYDEQRQDASLMDRVKGVFDASTIPEKKDSDSAMENGDAGLKKLLKMTVNNFGMDPDFEQRQLAWNRGIFDRLREDLGHQLGLGGSNAGSLEDRILDDMIHLLLDETKRLIPVDINPFIADDLTRLRKGGKLVGFNKKYYQLPGKIRLDNLPEKIVSDSRLALVRAKLQLAMDWPGIAVKKLSEELYLFHYGEMLVLMEQGPHTGPQQVKVVEVWETRAEDSLLTIDYNQRYVWILWGKDHLKCFSLHQKDARNINYDDFSRAQLDVSSRGGNIRRVMFLDGLIKLWFGDSERAEDISFGDLIHFVENQADFSPDSGGDDRDSAMPAYGGIDLARSNLNMLIRRDGAGIPLPVSRQNLESVRIDGLVPVIFSIQPVSSASLF